MLVCVHGKTTVVRNVSAMCWYVYICIYGKTIVMSAMMYAW